MYFILEALIRIHIKLEAHFLTFMYIMHVCFKSTAILRKFPSYLIIYIIKAYVNAKMGNTYAFIFHALSASVKQGMPQQTNAELQNCDWKSVICDGSSVCGLGQGGMGQRLSEPGSDK